MKKVLKMIADWRLGNKPANTKDYGDIPEDERDNNSWWYLHGKLEGIVHYDKATVTNCKSGGFAKSTINWTEIHGNKVISIINEKPTIYRMYYNGVVDVEIEGIEKPCIGFFYTANERQVEYKGKLYDKWDQRGLVCLAEDEEGCKHAKEKMIKRSSFL